MKFLKIDGSKISIKLSGAKFKNKPTDRSTFDYTDDWVNTSANSSNIVDHYKDGYGVYNVKIQFTGLPLNIPSTIPGTTPGPTALIRIDCGSDSEDPLPNNVTRSSGGVQDKKGITNNYVIVDKNGTILPQNSMYHSNRYFNATSENIFNYTINKLDNTKHYKIVLHFAETWFGKDGSYDDSREFDILINDVKVRKNFNIVDEARLIHDDLTVSDPKTIGGSLKAFTFNTIVKPHKEKKLKLG